MDKFKALDAALSQIERNFGKGLDHACWASPPLDGP